VRVLITGITGLPGRHLARYALDQRAEVFGAVERKDATARIEHLRNDITLVDCDLRDPGSVRALVDTVQPDRVFHLAEASRTTSRAPHLAVVAATATCQINLLEAIRTRRPNAVVHIAGSFEEYGLVFEEECPITEGNQLRPLSPFAVSKVAQGLLGYQYFLAYGLRIIRTRAFDHTGSRLDDDASFGSDLARQIVEVEFGRRSPVIGVRNVDARREFMDVRDVVRAYWLAVQDGTPGEVYNVSTGQAYSIKQLIPKLIDASVVPSKVRVVIRPEARLSPGEIPLLVGDSRRLRAATGWEPQADLEQSCAALLEHWRARQ
jgi:GDP-4-dehydro-6-deoxy-D-mannose reductase